MTPDLAGLIERAQPFLKPLPVGYPHRYSEASDLLRDMCEALSRLTSADGVGLETSAEDREILHRVADVGILGTDPNRVGRAVRDLDRLTSGEGAGLETSAEERAFIGEHIRIGADDHEDEDTRLAMRLVPRLLRDINRLLALAASETAARVKAEEAQSAVAKLIDDERLTQMEVGKEAEQNGDENGRHMAALLAAQCKFFAAAIRSKP